MANATALTAGLAGLPGLTLPREPARREHVWHQYTVRVGPDARVRRDGLVRGLAERGVGAGVFYPRLVHEYPCYREDPRIRATPTPRAAAAAAEVVSLPVHPHLSDAQLTHVVDAVREVFDA
jgi:dTDP-4-amino-4,6-dideoxygalactose transaminase